METLELNNCHYRYWTDTDRAELESVSTFSEAGELGKRIIMRYPTRATLVSGAITSGPGDINDKLELFRVVIEHYGSCGLAVFSQLPFEHVFRRLMCEIKEDGYCYAILTQFYDRILRTGRIRELAQLPCWRSSIGAIHEYESSEIIGGIECREIPIPIIRMAIARFGNGSSERLAKLLPQES